MNLTVGNKQQNRLRLTYVVSDFVTTSLAWFLFNFLRFHFGEYIGTDSFIEYYHWYPVWGGQLLFPFIMLFIYWLSGYYNDVYSRSRLQEFLTTASSVIIGSLLIFFLALVNDVPHRRLVAYEFLAMLGGLQFVFVFTARCIITTAVVKNVHRRRSIHGALMIGNDPEAVSLANRINSQPEGMGLEVIGFVPIEELERVTQMCCEQEINHLILSPGLSDRVDMPHLMSVLLPIGASVFISPGLYHLPLTAHRVGNVTGEPLVDISRANISASTANIKRAFDVMFSSLALIVLSPLMLGLAIAVKSSTPGSVFYRQERMGRRKRTFRIIKFRSMVQNAEQESGPALSTEDDPRITRVGRFMRKYRMDELPQFWNVIVGDMSLVGPRPERRYYADMIAERVPLYSMLYQVRPGITSWGMVKFGYASTVDEMVERLRFDLIYMENMSMSTDLKILIHTVKTVLSGRGK